MLMTEIEKSKVNIIIPVQNSNINNSSNNMSMDSTKETVTTSSSNKTSTIARTRSSNVTFKPPKTHDMVRSLFDPTIKKSFLDIVISFILILNFILAYILITKFGINFTKNFYLLQYIFWRIAYNVGIGILLHYQSHYETLTKLSKNLNLFDKRNKSTLARFLQFELKTKLVEGDSLYHYPEELNTWLIFRQFVDLILMQDFDNYMIFVFLSLPIDNLSNLINWKSLLGVILIIFNIWVKIDAHRVVKDFAWYWGDFFFLQENSELIFDGVFNISPHPMYSIGYAGYYGLSLISGDYQVLLVSIFGHFSQFLFLKYVETPHIERTYGMEDDNTGLSNNNNNNNNSTIDDIITKENYDYSRPLISIGVWFEHFDKLRMTDIFTLVSILSISTWFIINRPSTIKLFWITLATKLLLWLNISFVLFQQSRNKWFTKLYLRNGYTQVYSYQQWQFLYNYSHTITYTLLIIQTINGVLTNWESIDLMSVLFGSLLICLQIWCNIEIRSAISDFGWFYGDFFLNNYIISKRLTSQGIYKYLNDPETILGVAGIWGTAIMTNFSKYNIRLAILWTLTNYIMIKFIERPHMIKIYGQNKRISGVRKQLLSLKPIRRVSEIVDNIEEILMRKILLYGSGNNKNNNNSGNRQMIRNKEYNGDQLQLISIDNDDSHDVNIWENIVEDAVEDVIGNGPDYCFRVKNKESEEINFKTIILPDSIIIQWRLPKRLYHERDWIGLYNILDTRNNRNYTSVSSNGHWVYTRDTKIEETDEYVSGENEFNYKVLNFNKGIYEFRYHIDNKHKVLIISEPFEIKFPTLNVEDNDEELFKESLINFLKKIDVLKGGDNYKIEFNKNFTVRIFSEIIRYNIGVDLSEEYIRNVDGDVNIISKKSWNIKKILDELV